MGIVRLNYALFRCIKIFSYLFSKSRDPVARVTSYVVYIKLKLHSYEKITYESIGIGWPFCHCIPHRV